MAQSYHARLWMELAEDARVAAGRLSDPELQRQLLIIAAGYEALARREESLARIHVPANSNGSAPLETPETGRS